MSGEHLWSAWIGELLASSSSVFKWELTDPETRKVKTWAARSLDLKAKVVCKKCNETWMSNLEGQAKVLLSSVIRDGLAVSLLPDNIAILAAFAFKCAVVCTSMNAKQEPFFTRAARERFRESLQIPAEVRMWFSSFSGPQCVGTFSGEVVAPQRTNTMWDDHESFIFTFAAGHLVLQVVSHRWADVRNRGKPLATLQQNPAWSELAIEFWPSGDRPLCWPPPRFLSGHDLDIFVHRWSNRLVPRLPGQSIIQSQ
jgi:hypothetical protein